MSSYTMPRSKLDKWTDQIDVLFRHMILEILESLSSFQLLIIHQIN